MAKINIDGTLKEVVGVQILVNGAWKSEVGGTSGTAGTTDESAWRKSALVSLSVPAVPSVSGTATTGSYTFAGTCSMALGSQGTCGLTAHGLGTAREVYFCSTAGTTKALPTGPTAFQHYYVSTRGYTDDTFTVGTSATGTAGTQLNFTGTAGTHMLWSKNL